MELSLGYLEYHLIAINVAGFLLFLLNEWLYSHTERAQIDSLLIIISLFGGSLGIVIAILFFFRKAEKETMMSRVFVQCVLIVQVVLFLIIKGHIQSDITLAFWTFFADHRVFLWYLIIINVVAVIAYGADKVAAIKGRSRIRIVTLLGLAFAGGSVGALFAMYAFNHKTRKDYFTVGIPLIILMQVIVVFFVMNMIL